MNVALPLKKCARCGIEKPATVENFYKHPTSRLRVGPYCRRCKAEYRRELKRFGPRPEPSTLERFMSFVERDDAGGCWRWTGHLAPTGYGGFVLDGRKVGAHRAAYLLLRGPIQGGLFVCHSCDTPACVNPDHLFVGTPAANTRDMCAKGRAPRAGRLTKEDAEEIRRLCAEGLSQREVAALFPCSQSMVSSIVRGRSWR